MECSRFIRLKIAESGPLFLMQYFVTAGDGNFIYSQADENQKGKLARLISPIINPQNSAHCMTFWFHMSGPNVGTLRIKLRYQTPEEYDQTVWMLSGDQGSDWKEGRVLLHKSVKHYQVSKARWAWGRRQYISSCRAYDLHA